MSRSLAFTSLSEEDGNRWDLRKVPVNSGELEYFERAWAWANKNTTASYEILSALYFLRAFIKTLEAGRKCVRTRKHPEFKDKLTYLQVSIIKEAHEDLMQRGSVCDWENVSAAEHRSGEKHPLETRYLFISQLLFSNLVPVKFGTDTGFMDGIGSEDFCKLLGTLSEVHLLLKLIAHLGHQDKTGSEYAEEFISVGLGLLTEYSDASSDDMFTCLPFDWQVDLAKNKGNFASIFGVGKQ